MAIPLYGSVGALFNRLGKCGNVVSNINSFQATLETSLIDPVNGIVAQYNNEPDLQAEIGNTWINLLQSLESPGSIVQQLAQDTINRMVYRDQPQVNQTITSSNITASINYVLQQMRQQGATVLRMTVGSSINPFVGVGNGMISVSTVRPFDGNPLENAFAEQLLFTCTADSYISGATAFNEQFTVTGEGSESDVFAFDWPLGSNAQVALNAIDGDTSNGAGNLLTNSGFTTWTNGVPTRWVLVTGVAGTNIQQSTGIYFSAGSAIAIIGDDTTLVNLTQTLNSSSGSTSTLSAQSQYSTCLFLRRGGTTVSAGVLQVDLVDGNGIIINDQAGTPNSFTIDLTTLTTNWQGFVGNFRIPEILPSSYTYRLHLTTPLNSGATVYLDKSSLGASQQLYTQGPFVAVHSGNVPFVQSPIADYATAQITNSRGAGGSLATWQTLLWRLLNSAVGFELIFPSSNSPTVSDSLIG